MAHVYCTETLIQFIISPNSNADQFHRLVSRHWPRDKFACRHNDRLTARLNGKCVWSRLGAPSGGAQSIYWSPSAQLQLEPAQNNYLVLGVSRRAKTCVKITTASISATLLGRRENRLISCVLTLSVLVVLRRVVLRRVGQRVGRRILVINGVRQSLRERAARAHGHCSSDTSSD